MKYNMYDQNTLPPPGAATLPGGALAGALHTPQPSTNAPAEQYDFTGKNYDHTHVWHPPLLIGTPHYVMIPSDWSSMRP